MGVGYCLGHERIARTGILAELDPAAFGEGGGGGDGSTKNRRARSRSEGRRLQRGVSATFLRGGPSLGRSAEQSAERGDCLSKRAPPGAEIFEQHSGRPAVVRERRQLADGGATAGRGNRRHRSRPAWRHSPLSKSPDAGTAVGAPRRGDAPLSAVSLSATPRCFPP